MPSPIRPVDPQAAGWRAFADRLRNHGNLGAVKTWRMWASPGDDTPPVTGELIWCRITPMAEPAEAKATRGPARTRLYHAPLRLEIELAVPGPDPSAVLSLWGLFESVIFPQDADERSAMWEALAAHGIRDIRLAQRAAPTQAGDVSTAMAIGTGSVVLDFYLDV